MNADKPRLLLLDIGMVLIELNFNPLAKTLHSLSGITPAQLQQVLTGEGLIQKYETGQIEAASFHQEVCRRIGTDIPWPAFLDAWNSVFDKPLLPDEVLAAAARKSRLWAISNTNKLHFDYMLRHFTFLRHFEGFVLSHEVGVLKPDAGIFLRALERTQEPASAGLFVDDQEVNVQAARDLGIESLQFVNPHQLAADLNARGLV
jgi:2-haloacid dehalogenase